MGIVFGDGREPWSVGRGKVRHWLHCRIPDVDLLPASWRAELADWLQVRGLNLGPVLVTRTDGGAYRITVSGSTVDIDAAGLPTWMQRPGTPEPAAPPRAHRRSSRA